MMGFVEKLMQGSSLMGYGAVTLGKGRDIVFRRIVLPSPSRVGLMDCLIFMD